MLGFHAASAIRHITHPRFSVSEFVSGLLLQYLEAESLDFVFAASTFFTAKAHHVTLEVFGTFEYI